MRLRDRWRKRYLRFRESWHRPLVTELRLMRLDQIARASGNPLLHRSMKLFSQNQEDGILLAILQRTGLLGAGAFLELGVGDGTENNSLVLLSLGWKGAWLGGEPIVVDPDGSRLSFVRDWITRENAVYLARGALAGVGLGLEVVTVASVDIDGNDYHVAQALLDTGARPAVLVVEYNGKFPPPARFVVPYVPRRVYDGRDFYGASLASWDDLLRGYDYRLVACTATGLNAYYVQARYLYAFDDVPKALDALFMPPAYLVSPSYTHPVSAKTVLHMAQGEVVRGAIP